MWRSLQVKLVVLYLLLILFFMELIGAYFVRTLTTSLISGTTSTIKNQTQLLATIAAPEMKAAHSAEDMSSVLSSFPQFLDGVVYLLNDQGVVVVTSAGNALIGQKRMDSIVAEVMVDHKTAFNIRFDPVTHQHDFAVAVPMFDRGFVGVAEYVVPIQQTYDTIRKVTTIFYTGSAFALLLTAVFSVFLSRAITRPVVDVTKQARNLADGNYTERVEVRSNDEIGELARAVNELTDRLEEAIESNTQERERLRAIIKYMADGVVAFDSQYRILFANDTARKLLATIQDCDMARELGLLNGEVDVAESDRAFVREIHDKLLYIHMTSIRKSQGLEGYVVLIRDVTEQEKLNQARRDFVANVSHELRTPLTTIKSYLEAIQDDKSIDEMTLRKFLDVIDTQTNRMVRLTRDLLQLSGLDSNPTIETKSVIAVETWLLDLMQRFYLQAKRNGLQLELDSNVSAAIEGDRDMLDRVLDNVVSNAINYTPQGGKVSVTARLEKDWLSIQVKDTGIGIPPGDLPHVFERFYRVDKARSRRRGGSGLGLALAKEITERHGGKIQISSQPNSGTTVTIYLPLAKQREACT
jgi:two-component system sensor histidine kinase VicK